jgi:hypothetical protein
MFFWRAKKGIIHAESWFDAAGGASFQKASEAQEPGANPDKFWEGCNIKKKSLGLRLGPTPHFHVQSHHRTVEHNEWSRSPLSGSQTAEIE